MDNMPQGRPGRIEEAARLIIGQAKMACRLVEEDRLEKVISLGGGCITLSLLTEKVFACIMTSPFVLRI